MNPQQIRKALVKLAEFKNRPHYDACTVRHIVATFETHPLREAILYFADVDPLEYTARLAEIVAVCKNKSTIAMFKRVTGVDVGAILDGKVNISNHTWGVIQDHFDVIEDISLGTIKLKEDFEYEASFDMWLMDAIKHSVFNWKTMTYNDDELNKAWLSFQDFRSSSK